jgi:hypothetical protein
VQTLIGSRETGSGLTIGCRGCAALHAVSRTIVLRAGPEPLTLVSLGRKVSRCVPTEPPLHAR